MQELRELNQCLGQCVAGGDTRGAAALLEDKYRQHLQQQDLENREKEQQKKAAADSLKVGRPPPGACREGRSQPG